MYAALFKAASSPASGREIYRHGGASMPAASTFENRRSEGRAGGGDRAPPARAASLCGGPFAAMANGCRLINRPMDGRLLD